jgi:hypothetical protein
VYFELAFILLKKRKQASQSLDLPHPPSFLLPPLLPTTLPSSSSPLCLSSLGEPPLPHSAVGSEKEEKREGGKERKRKKGRPLALDSIENALA